MMTRAIVPALLVAVPLAGQEPEIVLVPGFTQEFRGLSAHGDQLWASGRGGVYARSTDAGRSWKSNRIPGTEGLFLVDVQALGRDTACVLATSFDGGIGHAYRTTDGGISWSLTYEIVHPEAFLDGMAFWDRLHGVAFGDPIDGTIVVLRTDDGCASWAEVRASELTSLEGEAGFAASGTGIAVAGTMHAWIGTGGGAVARVLRTEDRGLTWTAVPTPMRAGPATGIFGIAFRDTLHGIAVAGNYQDPAGDAPTVLTTADGGRSWAITGPASPAGVRFGAVALPEQGAFVAAGPSGLGVSLDDGATWTPVDTLFRYGMFGRGAVVWASGPAGWIARSDLSSLLRKPRAPDR
jgi:photosystem II stability/assembly factor-like uncharacterized protein